MSKEARPHAYVCLWEYVPKKKGETHRRRWKLVECYGVDDNGYACTPSKHASGDRHSFHEWMNKKVWYNEQTKQTQDTPGDMDEEDHDWESIMGRAVTLWSVEGGVWLADLHPPKWVQWLSTQFIDELKKLRNWYSFLEDGYTLWAGTAREVEKMMFPGTEPQSG